MDAVSTRINKVALCLHPQTQSNQIKSINNDVHHLVEYNCSLPKWDLMYIITIIPSNLYSKAKISNKTIAYAVGTSLIYT